MFSRLRTHLPVVIPALVVALIALGFGAIGPRAAVGNAPIVIDSPNDVSHVEGCVPNDCTLRDAINAANQQAGPDTITFGPGLSNFEVQSALPLIDGAQGITIDGGLHVIGSQTAGHVLFGLVIDSDVGATIHDVTINDLVLDNFGYDGLQVCAGLDTNTSTCISTVDGVTMNNVQGFNDAQSGIRILGGSVDNVNLQDIHSSSNGANGLTIASSEDLSGIHLTGGSMNTNGANGVDISGTAASDISISDGSANQNTGNGYHITADDLSGLSFDTATATGNGSRGVAVAVTASLSNISVAGSTFSSENGGFYAQAGSIFDGTISGNTIGQNSLEGLDLHSNNTVDDMTIENNTVNDNGHTYGSAGIAISTQRGVGTIIGGNTLNNNGEGVELSGATDASSLRATISRNSIFGNLHLGINLDGNDDANGVTLNDDGDADVGPNGLLNYPVIANVTPQAATGTACANCLVELFVADPDPTGYGEGKTFIADATADGAGNFSVPVCDSGLTSGAYVTATATDSLGETSEFSYIALLLGNAGACPTSTPTPSPSPTATSVGQTNTPTPTPGGPTATPLAGQHKQGDLDCDGSVKANDALRPIRFSAGIPLSQPGGCPALDAGDPDFADVNCDGDIGPGDTVAILEHAAGVPIEPPEPGGCTPLGQLLPS